jgi:hypothetical protein
VTADSLLQLPAVFSWKNRCSSNAINSARRYCCAVQAWVTHDEFLLPITANDDIFNIQQLVAAAMLSIASFCISCLYIAVFSLFVSYCCSCCCWIWLVLGYGTR